jgi:hypothetical protein
MIVRMTAHPDQIRWWAQSALNGFDTLDTESAIANAKCDLIALLDYLDRTDDATRILGVAPVKSGVGNEFDFGDGERPNQPDLKVVRP